MSKTIDWSKTYNPKMGGQSKTAAKMGSTGSLREDFKKAQVNLLEQEKAQEMLNKAFPVMHNILVQRMVGRHPIRIVQPMPYTTETIGGMDDDDDDGFYQNTVKGANATFKSVTKYVPRGSVLTFVNLEKSMNQLWFKNEKGEDVGIYVEEQNRLMTHSDIYQLVYKNFSNE